MDSYHDDDIPNATETWRDYWKEMKDSYQVYRWVISELVAAESWPHIRRMTAFLLIMTVVGSLQPWTVTYIVDGLVGRAPSMLRVGLAAFAACLMLKSLTNRSWAREREIVLGENMGRIDIRSTELFFGKALGQHLHDGDVLSSSNVERGRSSVHAVQNLLLFEGVGALAGLLLTYLCLWFVSTAAALCMTALFAVHVGWMFYFNASINRVCVPLEKGFRAMNRYRADRWQYVERVKSAGMEAEESRRLTAQFRSLIGEDRRFWLWMIDRGLWRGLGNYAALFFVMCYGAWRVWNGAWTIGTLFPVFTWTAFIVENLWRVSHLEQQLNWHAPSVRSMMRALTLPPAVEDGTEELAVDPALGVRVEFEGLTCGYPGKDGAFAPVIRDVSFAIEPGSKVALIGPSGTGKTTIMRQLFRARDPQGGRILVNGVDLRRIRLGSWLQHVGYIAQQPQVFDGTIRDNLLFGVPPGTWDDDGLWDLMRRLCVDFGCRLTNGLETRVGKGGLRLSGGQGQRLMIGAAAARIPTFMVIDEATSSLDSTTERQVQEGLARSLGEGIGALIVAHRLSTVRTLCDTFIVLRPVSELADGEPQVEAVAHSFEELYGMSPTFRRLADDQGLAI